MIKGTRIEPDFLLVETELGRSPKQSHDLEYNVYIRIEIRLDDGKGWSNQQKHGVSFELAMLVFEDELCILRLDRVDEDGEQRSHAIGAVRQEPQEELLLLVVHVHRENHDGEEFIRIISARAAGIDDVRRYQEQEMD